MDTQAANWDRWKAIRAKGAAWGAFMWWFGERAYAKRPAAGAR